MMKMKIVPSCRQILILMIITGYILQYAVRMNISIAIIDMVMKNNTNLSKIPRYDWSESEKNNILGSFYWSFPVMALFSGRLSENYGPRIVMGTAITLAGIFTLLTPLVSGVHYYLLLVMRVGVGACSGAAWSCIMPLAVAWFAPTDRSKFLAHILASHLGTALSFILGGYLIDYFGWPSIFYITGGVTIIWSMLWFRLVYNSPNQHPRISDSERDNLRMTIDFQRNEEKQDVPWIKIFVSKSFWAIVVADVSSLFNVYFVSTYIPSYMTHVLEYNINETGVLSGLPFIGSYLNALVTCYLADKWRQKKVFSLLTIRRAFTTLLFLMSILCLWLLSMWGYNRDVSLTAFFLWQTFLSCSAAGFISNITDLTLTYSGTIHAISNGLGGLGGYFCTFLANLLIRDEANFQEWIQFFWILIGVDIFNIIFYCTFSSVKLQKWDPLYGEKLSRDT